MCIVERHTFKSKVNNSVFRRREKRRTKPRSSGFEGYDAIVFFLQTHSPVSLKCTVHVCTCSANNLAYMHCVSGSFSLNLQWEIESAFKSWAISFLRKHPHHKTHLPIDPFHLTSSSEKSWMRHTGGQFHCVFSYKTLCVMQWRVHFRRRCLNTRKPNCPPTWCAWHQSPRVTRVQGVNC